MPPHVPATNDLDDRPIRPHVAALLRTIPAALVTLATFGVATWAEGRAAPPASEWEEGPVFWDAARATIWPLAGLGLIVTIAAAVRAPRVRLGAALTLVVALATFLVVETYRALVGLPPMSTWGEPPQLVLMSSLTVVLFVGLVRRTVWGRWLALATGISTALAFHLSIWIDRPTWWADLITLAGSVFGLAGAVLAVSVAGADMRSHLDRAPVGVWWTAERPVARRLTIALSLQAIAFPMLVLYALQADVAAPAAPHIAAGVLALGVAAGVLLALRGRTIGLLFCASAGVGVLVMAAHLAFVPTGHQEHVGRTLLWQLSWLPAALGAFLLLPIAGRLWRLVPG